MVMRNRHEGSGASHWWDDLPPHMRSRFTHPLVEDAHEEEVGEAPAAPTPRPVFSRGELLIDLSKCATVIVLFSLFILLYLLVAMSYVAG